MLKVKLEDVKVECCVHDVDERDRNCMDKADDDINEYSNGWTISRDEVNHKVVNIYNDNYEIIFSLDCKDIALFARTCRAVLAGKLPEQGK